MDQKEIDELLKKGSFDSFNQKQEELLQRMNETQQKSTAPETPSPSPSPSPSPNITPEPEPELEPPKIQTEQKGRVMGQISRVTEESEAGTNLVMGFLESVLNTVSKQKSFISDMQGTYRENPSQINVDEAFTFVDDSFTLIEENIFSAMDAFQFQDIGRQKLMKVMYTLAKLNEYLNELLGGETKGTKEFGHKIEKKTLEHDKDKATVDDIVAGYQQNHTPDNTTTETAPAPENDISTIAGDDVDDIVAAFKKNQEKESTPPTPPPTPPPSSGPVSNDDVASIIAEFQKNQG